MATRATVKMETTRLYLTSVPANAKVCQISNVWQRCFCFRMLLLSTIWQRCFCFRRTKAQFNQLNERNIWTFWQKRIKTNFRRPHHHIFPNFDLLFSFLSLFIGRNPFSVAGDQTLRWHLWKLLLKPCHTIATNLCPNDPRVCVIFSILNATIRLCWLLFCSRRWTTQLDWSIGHTNWKVFVQMLYHCFAFLNETDYLLLWQILLFISVY